MEEKRIALSIIVPCYKVEKYLPKCLDSLMGQTLGNIEAICINDGSPDNCINILRDYESRYPDKIVVIDKPNEGVWRGRWDGIAIARGEYIGFLDSDDYVVPTFAESLYSAAKDNDADIAVCGFDRIELETGRVVSREMVKPRPSFAIDEEPGRLLELNGAPWNKCFKAETLKHMRNLKKTPRQFLMTWLFIFWLIAIYTAKLFLYLNRSFVTWCARGQSSTPSGKAKSILFSLLSWKSKTTTRQVGPICWPPLMRLPFFILAFRSYSVYRLLEVKISTMILSGLRDSSMITFQHGVGHLILI